MRAVLSRGEVDCVVFDSLTHACQALREGAAALIVSEEALAMDSADVHEYLISQPVWADLPIIVLSRSGSESPNLSQLLEKTGNVAVVERPVRISTFLSIVRASLRSRQRQYEVRDHLHHVEAMEAERMVLWKSERMARVEADRAARTKDEFLAVLSHELRTPMSAILGWARMLKSGMSAEETTQGIEVIERNARLQSQIIEDLLDMSRIMSGKFQLKVETVNVRHLVAAAVDSLRLAAEAKGVNIVLESVDTASEVRGDPNRLQQVFFNLLSNATKFTPRNGIVTVACKRVESHVEIVMRDTGIGIKPEFLPHVFERFQQQDAKTTRQYQGLGLGLAIVKHLVELHGGTVHAASRGEGTGAMFTVKLPISVVLTPVSAVNWSEQQKLNRKVTVTTDIRAEGQTELQGITVMVTDDEPDAREMLRKLLERQGAKVLVCGSALETLDRLQRHRPNILICDIGMPEVDGYELMTRLRASSRDAGAATPAIALTAFARNEDRTRSLLAGFQVHLTKPVEPEELIASIRSLAATG